MTYPITTHMGWQARPEHHAAGYERRFPGVYGEIERARPLAVEFGLKWPAWCYAPIGMVQTVMASRYHLPQIESVEQAAVAAGLAAWRMGGKTVLLIHADVQRSLWDTPATGDIPTDVLLRLPFWCVYVPLDYESTGASNLRGVFIHLEHDVNTGRAELRFVLDLDNTAGVIHGGLTPALIEIDERISVEAALEKTYSVSRRLASLGSTEERRQAEAMFVALGEIVSRCMSITLYLCAGNAELRRVSGDAPPPRSTPRKGQRAFAPNKPAVWEAGWRIGAAINAARKAVASADAGADATTPTGRTVRPHMRAAHWHTYRTGKGRTERIVHWLPPIPVGLPDDVDASDWAALLPVTARPVG